MLVFGTVVTLTTKFMYETSAVGLDGQEKLFTKPWFSAFAMFVAMSGSIGVHFAVNGREKGRVFRFQVDYVDH